MNFDLSETQKLFHSTVERFTRDVDVAAREKIRSTEHAYDTNRWSELAELGLLAIVANEDQGGLGGSLIDMSTIAEGLGSNNALDPWLENGALPIRLLSKANKTDILDSLIDGTKIAALAFAEPNSRYNLFPNEMLATAGHGAETVVLNGEKRFVMGGALADYLLVTASDNGVFGIYCIPSDSQGLETHRYQLSDGSLATVVSLNQTEVPASSKLAITFEQFKEVVAETCVLCSAEMLGLSQLLLNDTVSYVKEREQFGVSIGSFQSIQHGLVDCFSELEQMRSMLYRTLLLEKDTTADWSANVLGAKSFIADGANFIARNAVQYHGAMGITDEVTIGHAMKRILILSRMFGDAQDNLNNYLEVA